MIIKAALVSLVKMMSSPHRVNVENPGAGTVSVMGNKETLRNSDTMAPQHGSPPPEYTTTPYRATPWTIGSTEGTCKILDNNRLIDQAGVRANATPSPPPLAPPQLPVGGATIGATGAATSLQTITNLHNKNNTYQNRMFTQPSASVEAVLGAACEAMGFDIAEMWLRTGPKTHQLINSHLRPTALEDSVRQELVDVYYGDRSSERTHRLSPALCKRAKEAMDVVWVTAHTPHGAETLRVSISDVRTAVAVPVCHEASNINMTVIYFSIRRYAVAYVGGLPCLSLFSLLINYTLYSIKNHDETNCSGILGTHVPGGSSRVSQSSCGRLSHGRTRSASSHGSSQ